LFLSFAWWKVWKPDTDCCFCVLLLNVVVNLTPSYIFLILYSFSSRLTYQWEYCCEVWGCLLSVCYVTFVSRSCAYTCFVRKSILDVSTMYNIMLRCCLYIAFYRFRSRDAKRIMVRAEICWRSARLFHLMARKRRQLCQRKYNETLRRVLASIVPWKSNMYYIFWVIFVAQVSQCAMRRLCII